ncbi:MAG TPA: TetR family transcriptional regulator C-terminal domain-containing protein [Solirubrobacteraceae bacterium]|nr:TetR family transcriptional regulator C-terminal domain-containing protein [Solirubrobacteraceae bacterium]
MQQRRTDRKASDRRRAILDAAIRVIARSGVRGLRVEQVADEAQVAVSLLYYYFGNRNGLVQATLDHANERAQAVVRNGDSGRRIVELTLLAELDSGSRDTSAVWAEVLASAVFEPELRAGLQTAAQTWSELIADAIRTGRSDGSISPQVDAQVSAERLTALVEGLSAHWLAGIMTRTRARQLLADGITLELAGDGDRRR